MQKKKNLKNPNDIETTGLANDCSITTLEAFRKTI